MDCHNESFFGFMRITGLKLKVNQQIHCVCRILRVDILVSRRKLGIVFVP